MKIRHFYLLVYFKLLKFTRKPETGEMTRGHSIPRLVPSKLSFLAARGFSNSINFFALTRLFNHAPSLRLLPASRILRYLFDSYCDINSFFPTSQMGGVSLVVQ
jgi:hypothetical protein